MNHPVRTISIIAIIIIALLLLGMFLTKDGAQNMGTSTSISSEYKFSSYDRDLSPASTTSSRSPYEYVPDYSSDTNSISSPEPYRAPYYAQSNSQPQPTRERFAPTNSTIAGAGAETKTESWDGPYVNQYATTDQTYTATPYQNIGSTSVYEYSQQAINTTYTAENQNNAGSTAQDSEDDGFDIMGALAGNMAGSTAGAIVGTLLFGDPGTGSIVGGIYGGYSGGTGEGGFGSFGGMLGGGGGGFGGSGGNNGGGGGVGGGGVQQFGGRVTKVTYCTCGPNRMLDIEDPAGQQTQLIITPGTQIFSNYQTYSTGVNVLGTYTPGGQCMVYRGNNCSQEGSPRGSIQMIGTSAAAGQ